MNRLPESRKHKDIVRLGIVSDSHGHLRNTRTAVERLSESDVDEVIHCGDIGSTDLVPLFSAWPTHFVFGNVRGGPFKCRLCPFPASRINHDAAT